MAYRFSYSKKMPAVNGVILLQTKTGSLRRNKAQDITRKAITMGMLVRNGVASMPH